MNSKPDCFEVESGFDSQTWLWTKVILGWWTRAAPERIDQQVSASRRLWLAVASVTF